MSDAAAPDDKGQQFLERLNAATPRAHITPLVIAGNAGFFLVMTVLGISMLGGRAEPRHGKTLPE